MNCLRCREALTERSVPSAVHEGISVTNWVGPDLRASCKGGGPHQPEVKTTVTDADLMRFFES